MANPEHVALARQGSASVNAFARQTPPMPLDLSGADLAGADLRDCEIQESNLAGANLAGADLRNARLGGTDLRGAILRDADARGAGLHRANLQGADLRGIKMDPIGVGHQLMCASPNTFANVHWDKERLEEVLNALNLNKDWEIRYEILPKA
jgi:uncharacterized protein YjbI with pentapeptide repeats